MSSTVLTDLFILYNNSLGVMHKLLQQSNFCEWLYWEYYCKLRKTKLCGNFNCTS